MWQTKPEREQTEETKQSRWGFRGKTVWDWMPIVGALLIPIVIALGTGAITWRLATIENQRAEAERKLAEQRAQDEALQAYLDEMGNLVMEQDLKNAGENEPAYALARARTVTIMPRLDAEHNDSLIRFLFEADVMHTGYSSAKSPGVLVFADLQGVNLKGVELSGADLTDADLTGANLENTALWSTNLTNAFLAKANMRKVNALTVDLSGADLSSDYLAARESPMTRGIPETKHAPSANLSHATLWGANFHDAILRRVDFTKASLVGADLTNAKLTDARFIGADLSKADLTNADGMPGREILKQTQDLDGATMPDGQKYEDWLKSKGGSRARAVGRMGRAAALPDF